MKIQIIEKLFYFIVTSSYLLLPVGFLFIRGKQRDIFPIVMLAYGVIFFALLFSYDYLPREFRKAFQSGYTFLEYSFFSFFIGYNILNKKFRGIMIILTIAFFLFQIIYYFETKLIRLDSIPIGIETILILIYVIYYFYDFYKRPTSFFIYSHYCFWVSIGILIYLGGSFFFYILINHLDISQVNTFGNLTYVAEIIKNVMFLSAILIFSKNYSTRNKEKNKPLPFLDMI